MSSKDVASAFEKHRVILLAGADTHARHAALKAIEAKAKEDDDLDVEIFVADAKPIQDWFGSASTTPFLSKYRTVVVRNIGRIEFPDYAAHLIKSVPETGRVILCVDDEAGDAEKVERLAKNGEKWVAGATKAGAHVLNFAIPKSDQVGLIQTHADRLGVKISKGAIRLLLEMVANQPMLAVEELEKLGLFAADGQVITENEVRICVTRQPEYDVYSLLDAILARKTKTAISELRALLGKSKSVDTEIYARIFPSMSRQLALVWQARVAIESKSTASHPNAKLASALLKSGGLGSASDWQAKKANFAAQNSSLDQLTHCATQLMLAEARLKGLAPGYSTSETLELMVLNMCQAVSSPSRKPAEKVS